MLFEIEENVYSFEVGGHAEELMKGYYESKGYEVLHNTFAVVYEPNTTKYPEAQAKVAELFCPNALASMRHFTRCVLSGEGVNSVAPGQPDLLVFKPDGSEVFFSEVKTGSDRLKPGQMVGISMLHVFLGCRIEIARVKLPGGTDIARRYRWAWPGLMQLSPSAMIDLSTKSNAPPTESE